MYLRSLKFRKEQIKMDYEKIQEYLSKLTVEEKLKLYGFLKALRQKRELQQAQSQSTAQEQD